MPRLTIGDTLPNLEVETTYGKFMLYDFVRQNWVIIFSHPGDFTPMCTTELAKVATSTEIFEERGVKLLVLSCDDIQSHNNWIKDIESYSRGCNVKFPIIADPTREIIKELNIMDPDKKDVTGKQVLSRALHVVARDKKVKFSILYPATIGRNVDKILRVIDALQKTVNHKVGTPMNWMPGEPVAIHPSLSDDQAKEMFPWDTMLLSFPPANTISASPCFNHHFIRTPSKLSFTCTRVDI
ncbi:hypothetical protein NE237_010855 [Protea cynaroides]|uniref:Peroxiredoxin n=1 Tax=Protea cynaroides TaxID=273540 RepID=A0A9Q0L0L3_9MAGN|nr:hypothetical protein NE237_010855 [Protea cynaroides]